jgi:hypothetical protein
MTRQQPYRQGDVFIVPIEAIPAGAAPVERDAGRVVLAYGEVTGHAHAILSEDAILSAADDARFLRIVGTGATIVHEEHAPVALPPGEYRVVIGREWTDEMAARPVVD